MNHFMLYGCFCLFHSFVTANSFLSKFLSGINSELMSKQEIDDLKQTLRNAQKQGLTHDIV